MKRKIHLKNIWGIVLTLSLLCGCSPQATSAPSDTPTATLVPAAPTASPPTPTSEPPVPATAAYAGKAFIGPLENGEISFTVSADGLALDPGVKFTLKDVGCSEGGKSAGGYSVVSMEITLPKSIPIQNDSFKYGSDNMFEPGYGFEFLGQFNSATNASGTFKYLETSNPLEPCTYGPFKWSANAP